MMNFITFIKYLCVGINEETPGLIHEDACEQSDVRPSVRPDLQCAHRWTGPSSITQQRGSDDVLRNSVNKADKISASPR